MAVETISKAARVIPYNPDGTFQCAPLCVTATGAAGAGVTVTLPLVSSHYHYLVSFEITKFYAVLGVAAATPVVVTTTNLPGSPAFSFDQSAALLGTATTKAYAPTYPIRSSAVGTATTIVCPVQAQTIWRVVAWYFTAP